MAKMNKLETYFNKRTTGKWRNTETDFHPPPMGYADWQLELKRFLIAHGTQGVKQNLITKRFANWCYAPVVKRELEILQAEGKAQKFLVPNKSATATIWRATEKILED